MLKSMTFRSTLAAVACAISFSAYAIADDVPKQLNVSAGKLVTALESLSKQAAVELVYQPEQLKSFRTSGVKGTFTPDAAVRILLKGTPLELHTDPSGAMVISPPAVVPAKAGAKASTFSEQGEEKRSFWDRFRLAEVDQGASTSNSPSPPQSSKSKVSSEGSSETSGTKGAKLEEVIVTAQKRSERLQDVPAAVSALTGATLEAMGAESFTDYARSIPGLTFVDLGVGRQVPTIRGINPSAGAAAVSYYIGETPMPTVGGSDGPTNPALVDIDRIEVLRGPQGTLYGSSSIGGTIKLVPHAPNLSLFEGSAKGEALVTQGADGASPGEQAELVLNVPIVQDTAAVRGAFWYRNVGGFINRTFTNAGASGIAVGPVQGKIGNLPDEHTWGLRTTALLQPTEQFNLSAMIYLQHQHYDGFTDITGGRSNPNDQLVQSLIADVPEPEEDQFELYNVTAKYSFSRFNLVSSTSYSHRQGRTGEEDTSLIQLAPTFAGFPPTSAVIPHRVTTQGTLKNFTQEARLATSESIAGFDAVIGAFYSQVHTPAYFQETVPQYNALVAGNNPANPLYAPDGNLFALSGPGGYEGQTAEFGELTYHFTDALSLTGGLRHYAESNHSEQTLSGWAVVGNTPGKTVAAIALPASAKGFVYKGNLSYKLTPDHLLYAQFSEGFRPGYGRGAPLPPQCIGQAGPDVQPDSIKSYEVGAKTSWLDRHLTVNAAAYRINWSDIQQGRLLECGFGVSTNFGDAVVKGTELEVSAQLTHRASAGLSATYLRAQLQQDFPAFGSLAGDQIEQVPRWQYALYGETTFPLLEADDGFARLDYQYTGSSFGNYSRLSDGSFDPADEIQVVRLLNLRTGMRHHAWEFALSGTNLLNRTVRQFLDPWAGITIPIPGRPRYVMTRPRTFSLSATYQF